METKINIASVLAQVVLLVGQLSQIGTDPGPQIVAPKPTPTAAEPKLVLPCRVVRVVDGDTIDVVIPIRARVRLLDCWAPETRTTNVITKHRGEASAEHLRANANDRPGVLTVPIREGNGLSNLFSFGRLLGKVSVEGQDLGELQIATGHATPKKLPK